MTEIETPPLQSVGDNDETREARVMSWISLAALVFLAGIGAKAWFAEHHGHAWALWGFGLLFLSNVLIYWQTGNRPFQKSVILALVALLFIYLTASGGESNTGPLWIYVFPPLLFYLTGLRTGLALLLGCLLIAMIVFQFPELPGVTAQYSTDFKVRFFATISFEALFCYILESGRLKARNELMTLALAHEQAARTDELTGLSNRRDMQNRLTQEFSRYQRSGHHFSIVLVDLDLFKNINDDYGHDAGDEVLKRFSSMLINVIRQTDVAARWGGEEFLVLLPDTSLLQALTLAERIRMEVEQTRFNFNDARLPVTLSAGVCTIAQAESVNDLLRQADLHLYSAKDHGRNQVAPRVKSRAAPDSPPPDPAT